MRTMNSSYEGSINRTNVWMLIDDLTALNTTGNCSAHKISVSDKDDHHPYSLRHGIEATIILRLVFYKKLIEKRRSNGFS